jgi:hypothetical protein
LMKKPALIQTTVRLFPANEFEAATTRSNINAHVPGSVFHYPLKSRKNLPRCILKKGLDPYMSCIEIIEKAQEPVSSNHMQ